MTCKMWFIPHTVLTGDWGESNSVSTHRLEIKDESWARYWHSCFQFTEAAVFLDSSKATGHTLYSYCLKIDKSLSNALSHLIIITTLQESVSPRRRRGNWGPEDFSICPMSPSLWVTRPGFRLSCHRNGFKSTPAISHRHMVERMLKAKK